MRLYEHRKRALLAAALAAVLVSCQGLPEGPSDGLAEVTFSLEGAPTKAVGLVASNESRIDHWAIMIFNTANAAEHYWKASSTAGSISCYVGAGKSYRAYAIVNYPLYGASYFDPSEVDSEDDLKYWVSDLGGNAFDALVMFGSESLGTVSSNTSRTIGVSRLVSKVGIQKITRSFSDPSQAARPFTIKRIYLTNVLLEGYLSRDYTSAEIASDGDFWYNALSWHGSGTISSLDAFTADTGIGASLPNGSSYTTEHFFYAYPNALASGTDPRTGSWSPRHTRLVIEAKIGNGTYYYSVTIPTMARNNTYIITEATVRNLGSTDPEEVVPGAIDATFSTSTSAWEGNYSITENS